MCPLIYADMGKDVLIEINIASGPSCGRVANGGEPP